MLLSGVKPDFSLHCDFFIQRLRQRRFSESSERDRRNRLRPDQGLASWTRATAYSGISSSMGFCLFLTSGLTTSLVPQLLSEMTYQARLLRFASKRVGRPGLWPLNAATSLAKNARAFSVSLLRVRLWLVYPHQATPSRSPERRMIYGNSADPVARI